MKGNVTYTGRQRVVVTARRRNSVTVSQHDMFLLYFSISYSK